jgi:hypothetical protein
MDRHNSDMILHGEPLEKAQGLTGSKVQESRGFWIQGLTVGNHIENKRKVKRNRGGAGLYLQMETSPNSPVLA